ncbi:battenin-like [Ornithodoros turicata]|uniref:battenin-like n=1 Tax=Ornithodoros turicata TaxID=34597 RepID=UPI003138C9AF
MSSDILNEDSSNELLKASENADTKKKVRNLVGFWFLGLCNNYAYVVMLSAAFDILNKDVVPRNASSAIIHRTNLTRCNPTSTGAILLADILPALIVKLCAPFLNIATSVQVVLVVMLSCLSFLLTSFAVAKWMSFVGVICASIGSGLGEITFLAYSSHFHKDVISTWSSGTGGAGVLGALSYASMASLLTPATTLQVMLFVPAVLAFSFWCVLVHPKKPREASSAAPPNDTDDVPLLPCSACRGNTENAILFLDKVKLVRPLLRFMVPLGIVYFAEYFINQGLLELIVFKNTKLTHREQYRWLQVMYQVGVLISRSSVNILQVKRLWLLPLFQVANAVFIFFEAYYLFLPNFWIVVAVVLYEGLLGGCAYVNTFYRISQEVPAKHKEFSLRIASLADSSGIALAGAIALPVHDALCLMEY